MSASGLPAVLVTGSSGFVGRAVIGRLGPADCLSLGGEGWREAINAAAFRGRVVIHLAARLVAGRGGAAQYQHDNVDKTTELARAAARSGACRFVLLSTAKVHGEESGPRPFRADSPAAPADAYARSKWQAEEALRDTAARAGMPWVILRPPLVYGRGASGNFGALVRLADSPFWLPLADIHNRRSLVHVDDLAGAVLLAARQPAAAGRIYLPAHPQAVSTPALIAAVRRALDRPPRLFRVSPHIVERLAARVGLGSRIRKLTRSLEVDCAPLRGELGWEPRLDLAAGLREALRR